MATLTHSPTDASPRPAQDRIPYPAGYLEQRERRRRERLEHHGQTAPLVPKGEDEENGQPGAAVEPKAPHEVAGISRQRGDHAGLRTGKAAAGKPAAETIHIDAHKGGAAKNNGTPASTKPLDEAVDQIDGMRVDANQPVLQVGLSREAARHQAGEARAIIDSLPIHGDIVPMPWVGALQQPGRAGTFQGSVNALVLANIVNWYHSDKGGKQKFADDWLVIHRQPLAADLGCHPSMISRALIMLERRGLIFVRRVRLHTVFVIPNLAGLTGFLHQVAMGKQEWLAERKGYPRLEDGAHQHDMVPIGTVSCPSANVPNTPPKQNNPTTTPEQAAGNDGGGASLRSVSPSASGGLRPPAPPSTEGGGNQAEPEQSQGEDDGQGRNRDGDGDQDEEHGQGRGRVSRDHGQHDQDHTQGDQPQEDQGNGQRTDLGLTTDDLLRDFLKFYPKIMNYVAGHEVEIPDSDSARKYFERDELGAASVVLVCLQAFLRVEKAPTPPGRLDSKDPLFNCRLFVHDPSGIFKTNKGQTVPRIDKMADEVADDRDDFSDSAHMAVNRELVASGRKPFFHNLPCPSAVPRSIPEAEEGGEGLTTGQMAVRLARILPQDVKALSGQPLHVMSATAREAVQDILNSGYEVDDVRAVVAQAAKAVRENPARAGKWCRKAWDKLNLMFSRVEEEHIGNVMVFALMAVELGYRCAADHVYGQMPEQHSTPVPAPSACDPNKGERDLHWDAFAMAQGLQVYWSSWAERFGAPDGLRFRTSALEPVTAYFETLNPPPGTDKNRDPFLGGLIDEQKQRVCAILAAAP